MNDFEFFWEVGYLSMNYFDICVWYSMRNYFDILRGMVHLDKLL